MNDAPGAIPGSRPRQDTDPDETRDWIESLAEVVQRKGLGRADTRAALRDFFEVDERYIALAALQGLVADGLPRAEVAVEAITRLGLNPEKPGPLEG